jgi:hypothetical protein
MTPTGIVPVTFQFVVQCLNHSATPCPDMHRMILNNSIALRRSHIYNLAAVNQLSQWAWTGPFHPTNWTEQKPHLPHCQWYVIKYHWHFLHSPTLPTEWLWTSHAYRNLFDFILKLNKKLMFSVCDYESTYACVTQPVRAVFTHGPKGPGPRAANFQGQHIKKKNRVREKKGCPQERNLREIYTENTVMFCLLSVFCVVFAYT